MLSLFKFSLCLLFKLLKEDVLIKVVIPSRVEIAYCEKFIRSNFPAQSGAWYVMDGLINQNQSLGMSYHKIHFIMFGCAGISHAHSFAIGIIGGMVRLQVLAGCLLT